MINNNISSDVAAATVIASTVFASPSKRNLSHMYGVHPLQMNLENASYMENRKPGTIMDLGSLMLFLTQVSLLKTPLQQLPLLQPLLVLHLVVSLPSMPLPLLDMKLLEQLLLLPLLLKSYQAPN